MDTNIHFLVCSKSELADTLADLTLGGAQSPGLTNFALGLETQKIEIQWAGGVDSQWTGSRLPRCRQPLIISLFSSHWTYICILWVVGIIPIWRQTFPQEVHRTVHYLSLPLIYLPFLKGTVYFITSVHYSLGFHLTGHLIASVFCICKKWLTVMLWRQQNHFSYTLNNPHFWHQMGKCPLLMPISGPRVFARAFDQLAMQDCYDIFLGLN